MLRKALFVSTLFLITALAGCTTDEGGTGSASVYVKDAPTDEFAEIHVVFTEVRVHYAGDGSDDEADDSMDENETMGSDGNETMAMDDNETDDGGHADWVALFESDEGIDVDLLNASGARAAFLGEANLTAGKYTQIRIDVEEAYGIDFDGERHDFDVSSGTLKLVKSFDVEAGQETRIVIDFDLDRSIKQTGKGDWRMTPVIGKTYIDEVEDDEAGDEVSEEGEIEEIEDLEE